ncbi:MAG: HNH endonuclease [Cetobacterium sp.]
MKATIMINNKESVYTITEKGEVENTLTKLILKGTVVEAGYLMFRLKNNGETIRVYAHRLVAEYFVEKKSEKDLVVNHIDGNKLNNVYSNLEWTTQSNNVRHAHNTGLMSKRRESESFTSNSTAKGEEWKKVHDCDYSVSNFGRVRSHKRNIILKDSLASGYLKVSLSKNGEVKGFMVHKLVYAVFNNEPYNSDSSLVIDHIDGVKTNNKLSNLRKITISENVLHGLYTTKTNSSAKPVNQLSKKGNIIASFMSASEAGREMKLDGSSISKVCRGINKTCGGFIWQYK